MTQPTLKHNWTEFNLVQLKFRVKGSDKLVTWMEISVKTKNFIIIIDIKRGKVCKYRMPQFKNFRFQMSVPLKLCILDPLLVKPKCVWEAVVFFNFRKFVYIFQLFVYNFSNKLPPLKHILALPTWGQKCTVFKIQPFTFENF